MHNSPHVTLYTNVRVCSESVGVCVCVRVCLGEVYVRCWVNVISASRWNCATMSPSPWITYSRPPSEPHTTIIIITHPPSLASHSCSIMLLKASDSQCRYHRFYSIHYSFIQLLWVNCSDVSLSLTKQCNMVLAKEQWHFVARKLEGKCGPLTGLRLKLHAGWPSTDCVGSASTTNTHV